MPTSWPLATPERLAQRREVRAHHGEIVLSGVQSHSLRPSIGSSVTTATPASRATVSASPAETSGSAKTVVAESRTSSTSSRARGVRARTPASGRRGKLREPVARRELAEGGVRRHDRAAFAIPEPDSKLRVELPQRANLARRCRPFLCDAFDGPGKADRVEPDVWILVGPEQVERLAVPPVDRVLERGLEAAADVDDQLGVADRLRRSARARCRPAPPAGVRLISRDGVTCARSAAHARG